MKTPLFLVLAAALTRPGWGQAVDHPSPAAADNQLKTFFSAPEVVLPNLYQAAIAHSGEILRLEASKNIASADVKLAKKRILNMLAMSSSYNYGTLPYFATAETTTPIYQLNPFNLGARAQYSAGLNLVVPIDLLASRRTTIDRQQLMLDQVMAQRQAQEMAIRQQVIVQYQALVLARVTQQNLQETLQSASINRQIADRRFKQGEIQIDEQMAAIDFYSKAQLAFEESRNRYKTNVLLLEELIGRPITSPSLTAQ